LRGGGPRGEGRDHVVGLKRTLLFSLLPTVILFSGAELVLRVLSLPWMSCIRTRACFQPRARFVTQQGRNFSPETGEPLLVYHPRLFWRQRRHVEGSFWRTPGVRTNEFGLRQGPIDTANRRNILVVGDSVVWGSSVREEERFSDTPQRKLWQQPGHGDVQVVNAGVVGYSSFQVFQYLREEGMSLFRPSVVVVCVGINDNWGNEMTDRERYRRSTSVVSRLRDFLVESDLFAFVTRYTPEAAAWLRTGENPKGFSVFLGGKAPAARVLRNSPEEAAANIREMGTLVEAGGAELVMVLQQTRGAYPLNWSPEAFRAARRGFKRLAKAEGWHTIEIAQLEEPPFGMSPASYLLDFCHPSPQAHALIGHWVADAVAELLHPEPETTGGGTAPQVSEARIARVDDGGYPQ
jgi:lysophospholipase L1-like esterase